MNHQEYAYIRVSSRDQNEDRQILALKSYTIPKENYYIDKMSGKNFNRPAYQALLKQLRPGDILYIHSIDRLGRNYEEIIEQWKWLTKNVGVDLIVLDMPLLNTTLSKDLLGTFISDLVLQLLSFVAENERNMIKRRQAEGIEAAKLRGVRFGAPSIPKPDDLYEIIEGYQNKSITAKKAAKQLNISISTVYRWLKEGD